MGARRKSPIVDNTVIRPFNPQLMTLEYARPLPPHRRLDWWRLLQQFGPLLALVALVTFTSIVSDRFLTAENVLNILRQNSAIGILALGMTFVILLGGIDLSVGSTLALAGCVGIVVLNGVAKAPLLLTETGSEDVGALPILVAKAATRCAIGGSIPWAIIFASAAAVLLGTVVGVLNGILIAYGRAVPFIITLGTMAIMRSLAVTPVSASEYRSQVPEFRTLGASGIQLPFVELRPGVPLQIGYPVLVFFALVLLLWVLHRRTRYGRYVVAIGCNEQAAVYSAISVNLIKVATYSLMGLLAGIAGLLQASRLNSVSSSSTGMLSELDAIAAVAVGGTSMRGGSGGVWGTVVGVLLLGVTGNMLNMLNINPYLQGAVKGAILIGAVLLQRGRSSD